VEPLIQISTRSSITPDYLFNPESNLVAPWDKVFDWSPPIAIGSALLMLFILVFWGATLLRMFWNRFVSDVFKLRNLTYDESLAIVLIIAIFLI
jgi:hypothetical protein